MWDSIHKPKSFMLPVHDLDEAWPRTSSAPPVRWADAKGPVDAAWLSLARLGWQWEQHDMMVDQQGKGSAY